MKRTEQTVQLIGEIASASNEQATGIAQINNGIEQLSQVVQTNSATAEEAASASEELSSQAMLLNNMVAQFKLKGKNSPGQKKAQELVLRDGKTDDVQNSQLDAKSGIYLSATDFGKY